ncbi:MAG: hypothetical protein HYZ18_00835 [Pseudogulbenkiania sp.]|nr:hypothetical protein [Pseudogulbenkiania sp.]
MRVLPNFNAESVQRLRWLGEYAREGRMGDLEAMELAGRFVVGLSQEQIAEALAALFLQIKSDGRGALLRSCPLAATPR